MSVSLKRVVLAAGALLVLVFAGWIFARPAYHHWREARALDQARQFLVVGDVRNAVLAARRALVLNATNVEACRVMAHLSESVRSPVALDWRRKVAALQPGNFTNQIQLARTAVMLGYFDIANAALEAVPASERNHPTYHQLHGLLALAEQDPDRASLHLTEAARLAAGDKQTQLNLAVLGLQGTNSTLTESALRSLRELATLPEFRVDALRHLASHAFQRSNHAVAVTLTRELIAETNATILDRLLHLHALLAGDDDQGFRRGLSEVQAHCREATNGFGALTTFLLLRGRAQEAADWLAGLPAGFQSRLEVKVARAETCEARKDWPGLDSLLRDADWAEADFLRHAWLARARRETGGELAAQLEWRVARAAAEGNARRLAALVRLAAAWSWSPEQEELLWQLVERHPAERWAAAQLHQRLLEGGQTLGLQRFYELMAARHPDDLAARNNLATVCLLLQLQLEQAHRLARSAFLGAPTNAAFASTYAYSLHFQGRTEEGISVLEAMPAAALEQPAVALYHGVLCSFTQPEVARKFLDLGEQHPLLLPEEKQLLQAARKRL